MDSHDHSPGWRFYKYVVNNRELSSIATINTVRMEHGHHMSFRGGHAMYRATRKQQPDTGSGDALNPDGTEAQRLQVSARFTF